MAKVSIVIPTHNMANYLTVALDSTLDQSYPDIEVIVVDDGSTDDTPEVVRPYLPRIRYFRQEQQGVAVARNRALELVGGEYVRFLDADDALCPDALSPQVDLLDRYPQVALVHGHAYVTDGDGNVEGLRRSPLPSGTATVTPSARAFRRLLRGCDICASTVMVRKTALQRVGPFQQQCVPGEDWDVWLRIAAYFDLAYIPRPLAYYRVHLGGATAGYALSSFADSHLHTLRALFSRPDLPYPHLENLAYACLDRTIALVAARLRHRGPFARYLRRALQSQPRLFLEGETWNTLYEGCKLLVPFPAVEAVRRLKRKTLTGKRPPGAAAEPQLTTDEAGGLLGVQSATSDLRRDGARSGGTHELPHQGCQGVSGGTTMFREWLSRLRERWLLRCYVRAGLRLGRDVRVIGEPDFGSEPYLIEIGDHVTISSNVTFITHDGGTWVFRHLPPYLGLQRFGRIIIADNCFIGSGVIIMPDVSIGPNSVVGAGAVVTRSVPANSVVAGVPARHICSYEQYVERMIPRCRSYPPDVTADREKLKDILLSTIPHPTVEEGQSPTRSGSVGEP